MSCLLTYITHNDHNNKRCDLYNEPKNAKANQQRKPLSLVRTLDQHLEANCRGISTLLKGTMLIQHRVFSVHNQYSAITIR